MHQIETDYSRTRQLLVVLAIAEGSLFVVAIGVLILAGGSLHWVALLLTMAGVGAAILAVGLT